MRIGYLLGLFFCMGIQASEKLVSYSLYAGAMLPDAP